MSGFGRRVACNSTTCRRAPSVLVVLRAATIPVVESNVVVWDRRFNLPCCNQLPEVPSKLARRYARQLASAPQSLVAAISTLVFVRLAKAISCAFSNWAAKFRASPSKARPEFGERAGIRNPRRMAITTVTTNSSTNVKAPKRTRACFGNVKAWVGHWLGVDTAGRNLNQAVYSAETETWKAETEIRAQKLRTKGRR